MIEDVPFGLKMLKKNCTTIKVFMSFCRTQLIFLSFVFLCPRLLPAEDSRWITCHY